MVRIYLILLFSLCSTITFSQTVKNVDFTVKDNKITVTYDLTDCPANHVYDIKLKFKQENGELLYPAHAEGDLKRVSPGNGKSITWEPLKDNIQIKGGILAVVEIDASHSKGRIKGGPANAFLSMLLPGVGDLYVNSEAKPLGTGAYGAKLSYQYYIMAGYIGCAAIGVKSYLSYTDNYDKYHSATAQSEMDRYYSKAKQDYQITQLCFGAAAAIWVGDVIYVTVKGFKNRREQLNGYSVTERKYNLYFAGTSQNFQIGLSKKL